MKFEKTETIMVKSIESVFALLLQRLVPKVWDFFFSYSIHGLPVRKFFGVKRKPLRPSLYSLSFWGWGVSLGKSSGSEYTSRHISLVNKIKLDLCIDIHRKLWIQFRFSKVQMNLSHSGVSEPRAHTTNRHHHIFPAFLSPREASQRKHSHSSHRESLTPAWLQSNSRLFSIVSIKQRGHGAAARAAGRSRVFNTELDYSACEKCGRKGFLMVQMMLPQNVGLYHVFYPCMTHLAITTDYVLWVASLNPYAVWNLKGGKMCEGKTKMCAVLTRWQMLRCSLTGHFGGKYVWNVGLMWINTQSPTLSAEINKSPFLSLIVFLALFSLSLAVSSVQFKPPRRPHKKKKKLWNKEKQNVALCYFVS